VTPSNSSPCTSSRRRPSGSGATFPFPLYSAGFKSFSGKHKGLTVDDQGKGSGAGIRDLVNRTVDFAASDAAMTDEDMAKVPGGVQLLPMTGGQVVLAYSLPGQSEGAEERGAGGQPPLLGGGGGEAGMAVTSLTIRLPESRVSTARRGGSAGDGAGGRCRPW
jgi:phosphate transport system substrate-binding protein